MVAFLKTNVLGLWLIRPAICCSPREKLGAAASVGFKNKGWLSITSVILRGNRAFFIAYQI